VTTTSIRLTILLFVVLLLFPLAVPVRAEHPPSRADILILHSYHPGFPWTDAIDRGIRKVLESDPELQIFSEYLDSKRFSPAEQFPRMAQMLRTKYRRFDFRLVITSDDNALDFALRFRGQLFPDASIVFCGVNDLAAHQLKQEQKITGIPETFDIAGTLRLALQLFPRTRTIALVSDVTPTGRTNLRRALALREGFQPGVSFLPLAGLNHEELAAALRRLPDDSLVLNLGYWRGPDGTILSNRQSLRLLTDNCRVPIFTLWDFMVGSGIFGGLVVDGERQGQLAALQARRLLQGETSPPLIDILSPNTPIFDWHALQRFGIAPDDLPEGSRIRNLPDSWLTRNRKYVWMVAALLLVETALIGLLLVNIVWRRRSEARLKQRETDFRKLIEVLPIPIRINRLADGRIVYLNQQFTQLFGYDRQDLRTIDDWFELAYPEPDYREHIRQCWQEQVRKTPHFDVLTESNEWRVRCKDGSEREIVFGHTRLSDLDVVTMFDVTSRNRAVREHQALERKMLQAQKLESLGILAGGIAHDFNNLLMGVLGCADITLRRLPPNSPLRETVEMIVTSAERAADLTRQMLAYSGKGRFVIERVDLNQLVEEMAHLLRTVISKNALLRIDPAPTPVTVMADTTQLRQVIMNLITNASDALEGKSGIISITTGVMQADAGYLATSYLDDKLESGPYAFVEVTDTGCGMDAETVKRIFDPFFSTKFTGRGLGLAAVLGIIRGHRGTVRIYSEPGKGTSFKILLPCDRQGVVEPLDQQKQKSLPPDLPERCGTVLIIDDDETVCSVGRLILEEYGLKVLTASDGEEGIDSLRRHLDEIGLILLDLTMPHLSGEEVFQAIRRLKPQVRVILSSGYNEQEATARFVGKGLAGFLHKPYRSDELLDTIIRVVSPPCEGKQTENRPDA